MTGALVANSATDRGHRDARFVGDQLNLLPILKSELKPGDVVEILGCPGNDFWGNESVDLAIVVKTPPTVAEVEEMRKQYFATHSGFDLCDHALSFEFDDRLDTYEVIPYALGGIDHAPTICVFEPTKQVSLRRKKALMEMYKKYGKDN